MKALENNPKEWNERKKPTLKVGDKEISYEEWMSSDWRICFESDFIENKDVDVLVQHIKTNGPLFTGRED